MEYITLGKTGVKISRIGLGAWQFGGDAWGPYEYNVAKSVIAKAVELGINFIDTAAVYGRGRSEEFVGRAIRELGIREQVFVATKIPGDWHRFDDVLKAARRSRERLGLDVIDLLQLHWPACWHNVPICETMRAMERLVDDGVIRFFGLSNFDVNGIEEARSCLSKYDVAAVENRYSLLHRVDESSVIPYVQRNGMLYLAYTPIEKGAFSNNEFLMGIGKKYGKTAIQVVLNWYVGIDNLVPIPKAGRVEHVRENAGAMGWRLSRDDWELISNHFH